VLEKNKEKKMRDAALKQNNNIIGREHNSQRGLTEQSGLFGGVEPGDGDVEESRSNEKFDDDRGLTMGMGRARGRLPGMG
jgi:hypothetical protein